MSNRKCFTAKLLLSHRTEHFHGKSPSHAIASIFVRSLYNSGEFYLCNNLVEYAACSCICQVDCLNDSSKSFHEIICSPKFTPQRMKIESTLYEISTSPLLALWVDNQPPRRRTGREQSPQPTALHSFSKLPRPFLQ